MPPSNHRRTGTALLTGNEAWHHHRFAAGDEI